MINSPPQKYVPNEFENKIRKFWEENDIFQKSIDQRKGYTPYVFLEGPPTANGLPHPGHVLTRVVKDLVLRYQTMNGHFIERKAGWDTHGLPVEIEVEKSLGLEDKQAVEKYGIKKFNEECKKCVFKYENAWVDITKKIGFWIDMEKPYITLKNEYIESVWWSLKQAWEKKLLYKGHKVVPYCPRCGTPLSAHEISQGYKTIEEPSIFVKFKIKGEDAYFLAWTTTPWTLLSNVALAVHPDETYVRIRSEGEELILAEERAAVLLKGQEYDLIDSYSGKELEGKEYEPLFDYCEPEKKAWYIVLADFVTMEDGTGIVHIAPAFGEDDYNVGKKYDLPVIQLVKLDGTFPPEVKRWAGQFVKDADPSIIEYLEERGLLSGTKKYSHEYPFCWRCDSPLLYYAMESWFIAMSKVQDSLIKNNNNINWYPSHLQQGRFGDFIREVKDWALSRKRYWGTPLPIWTCKNKSCKNQICIGSIKELKELSESFPKNFDLHKPLVDELVLHCPKCKEIMKREEEVIDCWYDSGSAFFAQWHYPFENEEKFKQNFPVDFISEALDQTRGWFYSLLAISTFLFDDRPYKNVLTLGLVLDKDNQKMSKSKRNYLDPNIILEREGADALRWYLVSANAPWMSTRFYEQAVKDTLGKFILTFWNSYNFFATYASIDNFNTKKDTIRYEDRTLIDKWIISKFNQVILDFKRYFVTFELHKAARAVENFIIEDFSNWYLRRSRKRLWIEEKTDDKLAGYSTMYEIFLDLSKLIAPIIPFITEVVYQNLRHEEMPESIHLCNYLEADKEKVNKELEEGMQNIRDLVEVGRALRSKIGIKVRYPLSKATLVCTEEIETRIKPLLDLLNDEINVKEINFERDTSKFMEKTIKLNHSKIGPKFREKAKKIVEIIEGLDKKALFKELKKNSKTLINFEGEKITLDKDYFQIIETERENIAKTGTNEAILLLNTELTANLESEGFAREIVRRIQSMRKEMNLEVEDKIVTKIKIDHDKKEALNQWLEYIQGETRSKELSFTDKPSGQLEKKWDIEGVEVLIAISK
ncbi:MAG: isoleucine--tRNA ligase [Candidatus Thermoplasmatota archaeon]|nr:isoleucine--tRNA ligase [Candidatus Thermoplasmatota archaeon]